MRSFFKKFIAGIVIGIGAIIPGFSGGILAVSMGLYKPTIEAVTGFFKAPKKNFNFLLPLALGGALGFVVFMFLLDELFESARTYVICVFIGLVVGSLPSLMRECLEKGYKKSYPLWSVLGFVVAFALVLLGILTNAAATRPVNWYLSFMSGAIIMSGVLLPGISISFILLNLGVYESFMNVFTEPPKAFISLVKGGGAFGESLVTAFSNEFPNMLFGALGAVVVAVPMLLLVRKVINRFHGQAYFLIFGIVIATTLGCIVQEAAALAAPGSGYVFAWWKPLLYAALIASGAVFTLLTEKFMRYREEKEEQNEQNEQTEQNEQDEQAEQTEQTETA